MEKTIITNVNGTPVENALTPALIQALNNIAVQTYDMCSRPVYVYDNTGRAYYVPTLFDPARRRCSYDNGKTGYPSINTLAGCCKARYSGSLPAVIRALFPDIKGTCPETCPGCYALPITRNFIPAITTILNTIETEKNPARFYALVEKELYGGGVLAVAPECIRVHDTGEFQYAADLYACFDFISRHKETDFYSYSKSKHVAAAYTAGEFPDNFHCACSPWIDSSTGNVYCAPVADMYQFIYDDGNNPDLDNVIHCPAVNVYGERTGVTCKQCGLCRRAKTGTKTAVYAHGNGATAAENIAARGGVVRGVVLTLEKVKEHREKSKAARREKIAEKKARKAARAAAAAN
jgi:hypothetical protein